jgi:peptidoglycan/LPS O-acetylase OafA/YrhL
LVLLSQLIALAMFILAMNRRVPRSNRALNALAAISYPLYTVHLTIGWSALALLECANVAPVVSLVLALSAVAGVARSVHWIAERPSLRLIERIK